MTELEKLEAGIKEQLSVLQCSVPEFFKISDDEIHKFAILSTALDAHFLAESLKLGEDLDNDVMDNQL